MVSLVPGLAASGALSLAVATDFWLFTDEPMEAMWVNPENASEVITFTTLVTIHSGLWRACTHIPGKLSLLLKSLLSQYLLPE